MINIPTDNLYKFLTIVGLIITLFGFYYPFEKSRELHFIVCGLKGETEVLGFENDHVKKKFEYITDRLKQEEDQDKRDFLFEDYYKSETEPAKPRVKIQANIGSVKVLIGEYLFYKNAGFLGLLLGVILIIIGFLLWYTKVQRSLDNQLRRTDKGQTQGPTTVSS